jgi:hypothetical protein
MVSSVRLRLASQRRPNDRIGRRGLAQTLEQCPYIQACAADDQWETAGTIQIFNSLDGVPSIETCVEWLVRFDQIDQAMSDVLQLIRRRLIGPDIHSSVDLPGVGRQNLGLERLRDLQCDAALADGRRPHDDD